ncbi:MAG: cytochrome c oxidase assembly protein [Jatrophihabitans sp.]|uniref:cytochrome c oxidase assembly protein n=1 Tax=Jatrophihabitans sp. TaxID=1932789 RepID=UPI003F8194EB
MTAALPAPSWGGLLSHWTVQPVAVVVAVLVAGLYTTGARRARRWPLRRSVAFGLGLALFVWLTCGWFEVYRHGLFWVWTAQQLLLWLVVPVLLLGGGLLHLAPPGSPVARALQSRPLRVLANPLVGPALVPVLSAVLFFGPLPAWAVAHTAVAWLLQLALVVVGALMVLPLVGPEDEAGSLAVGLSLAIGAFELVLDAVPGIALRLHTTLVTSFFDHRATYGWSPRPIKDQQLAGNIVWCMAEIIDLPFLLLVFRRWLRADAREAASVDAVLEAERIARGDRRRADDDRPDRDQPWWLSDPSMRDRFGPGR